MTYKRLCGFENKMLTNHFILFIHKQNSYIYSLYASKPSKNVLVYGLIFPQKMFAISLKSSVKTVRESNKGRLSLE